MSERPTLPQRPQSDFSVERPTLPKKGLLSQAPQTSIPIPDTGSLKIEMGGGDSSIIKTIHETQSIARTHTDIAISRIVSAVANQPSLDHIAPEKLKETILRTFKKESENWAKALDDQEIIEKMIVQRRKERAKNDPNQPSNKLSPELLDKLSDELTNETLNALLIELSGKLS